MKSKGLWYLSGFRQMGFRYWFVALLGKAFLIIGLISEEDARDYGNMLLNEYLKEFSHKNGWKSFAV